MLCVRKSSLDSGVGKVVRVALRQAQRRRVSSMAAQSFSEALVTPDWLHKRLGDESVRILDASWFMPFHKRNNIEEFCARRIPGARFFDIDRIADTTSYLPHMLPTEAAFAAAADVLGITNSMTVIVYDGLGTFSAPRAWWTFRAFGHDRVAVLDGGFPSWQEGSYPVEATTVPRQVADAAAKAAREHTGQAKFRAKLRKDMVRGMWQMADNLTSQQEAVVDARSDGRFHGKEPEPRPGLPSGHIPGSQNVPFTEVLQNGRYKDKQALHDIFRRAGVDVQRPITCTCGSGVTASILVHALYQMGKSKDVALYDGSWSEWGDLRNSPKAEVGMV